MEPPQQSGLTHASYTKSWTAYVRPIVISTGMLLAGLALIGVNEWLAAPVIALAVGLFAFKFLTIRSLVLYTDHYGVWVYRGILPWSKGVSGVKWRDLEDAVYFPNFLGWLLKSYTVRVGHRFTKTSEIVLTHIACGHLAVAHINELHKENLVGP